MEYLTLWQNYKANKDVEAKAALIENYIEVVKVVAGRLYTTYGSNVEYDDLVSYGIFGLIDAIDKFELDKSVKFETYAQIRIRGAIIDQLRNLDWVPRSIRQKSKTLDLAYHKLDNSLGRRASDEEVAKEMGLSINDFQSLLNQVNNLHILSLEEKLTDVNIGHLYGEEELLPESIVCNQEAYEILKESIDYLPNREKQVITLYYYEELTYKEIGNVLGVSESRVSQLHTKAISRLKSKFSD
ncbi:FliA/WhiG family RNA polymerase sigma factor [Alkaliphilus hydrothermalis]|uniref:RNA polymerase sigma factor n=1 Tax=Alkaliphilus hydrothermalis TaxID=1482730 RepID=A0ABS2NL63_9FIRM|nr:FliA/WhiG family RNA polymerase sigma factor [Alkaliphilus hydrothermalis]MBM7613685.1 RNA polymerase sigma factor for flagellar operon FliA [Alkaliphilus hydrothermalis]